MKLPILLLIPVVLTLNAVAGEALPPFTTRHLSALSSQRGLGEFSRGTTPMPGRCCIEDTSRALVAVLKIHALAPSDETRRLARLYLEAIAGLQVADGKLHFGYGENADPLTRLAKGDSFGRTLWGLGHASAHGIDITMRKQARTMFMKALPHLKTQLGQGVLEQSYALQGLHHFLAAHPDELPAKEALRRCANHLLGKLPRNASDPWQWPSGIVSYDSARLPIALLLAFRTTRDDRYRDAGLRVLSFLAPVNFPHEGTTLHIIGNRGWYRRDHAPAEFDQQPVDASALVEASALAWAITRDDGWHTRAHTAFAWFTGRNTGHTPIYDPGTGGCRDGLGRNGANPNQGGESTVSFWIARCVLESLTKQREDAMKTEARPARE